MELTIEELKEKLATIDEISLLEILEIDSRDLVERFVDKIEDKADELAEDIGGVYGGY
jgi:anion-transporting  ArsA/GET3 family ATPase